MLSDVSSSDLRGLSVEIVRQLNLKLCKISHLLSERLLEERIMISGGG